MNHHPEIRKHIGGIVQTKRDAEGLSQEELAGELNVDTCTISRTERGVQEASASLIFDLAVFFKCSVNDFFPPVPEVAQFLIVLAALGNDLSPMLLAA